MAMVLATAMALAMGKALAKATAAAVVIQAAHRGFAARRQLWRIAAAVGAGAATDADAARETDVALQEAALDEALDVVISAAVVIQAAHRGGCVRRALWRMTAADAALQIQAVLRGRVVRRGPAGEPDPGGRRVSLQVGGLGFPPRRVRVLDPSGECPEGYAGRRPARARGGVARRREDVPASRAAGHGVRVRLFAEGRGRGPGAVLGFG